MLLFDEVEKAHPDTFNVLLQVLDDGRVTDSQGRTVDFKNCVIIMTSNLGSQYLMDDAAGVHTGVRASARMESAGVSDHARNRVMADVRAHFRPEFLNRIDDIVIFTPLDMSHIERIVTLLVADLQRRLNDRRITSSCRATRSATSPRRATTPSMAPARSSGTCRRSSRPASAGPSSRARPPTAPTARVTVNDRDDLVVTLE